MTKLFIAKAPNPIQIRRTNVVPEGNICLARLTALVLFTVVLSNPDFRAMILSDLGGKSYQECFSSLAISCFGEKSPAKSTVTKW